MKKLIVLVTILTFNFQLSTFNCCAQQNGGFEDWTAQYTFENPDYWQTLNILSIGTPPNDVSVFKATGVDKHSGNYALKLKTIYLHNNPAPQALPDTVGYVFTGKILISPPEWKVGIPYTGRPEKLEFWSKYTPVGNDVAGVFVTLKKWNGTSSDTVAYGDIEISSTASYSFLQINLAYRSAVSPDTLIIAFLSSDKPSTARVGSSLYIDDVALTGWVGIEEPRTCWTDRVKIFPNPAKEYVTIHAQIEEAENVQLTDALGRLTGIYKIQNYSTNINTCSFAEGAYFYEIRDIKGKTITNGKFDVTK